MIHNTSIHSLVRSLIFLQNLQKGEKSCLCQTSLKLFLVEKKSNNIMLQFKIQKVQCSVKNKKFKDALSLYPPFSLIFFSLGADRRNQCLECLSSLVRKLGYILKGVWELAWGLAAQI